MGWGFARPVGKTMAAAEEEEEPAAWSANQAEEGVLQINRDPYFAKNPLIGIAVNNRDPNIYI